MMNKIWHKIACHFSENLLLYLLIFLIFIGGITVGAMSVGALSPWQEGELSGYINQCLLNISNWKINSGEMLRYAIANNLKTLGLIWFLGLTVIGIPLVLGIIFFRGFILGFTVGFLVQERAVQGFLLSVFSILPQNIFNIPGLLVSAAASISFSLWLVKGRLSSRSPGMLQQLIAYSMWIGLMAAIVLVGALVEAYLSPLFVKLIASRF
ncbi:MAG: stage II sporulation protein M [Bacillota bacterium]